jgi:glycosyltransferase involved in cell wall biosynthesis
MPEYLSASDLCLILLSGTPVHKTVWPNKLFDYMACRRPTLVNFDGVTWKVLEEANAGYYIPRNAELWAEKIAELYSNTELRQTMGDHARGFVVRRFDRHRMAQRFEELLLEVAG